MGRKNRWRNRESKPYSAIGTTTTAGTMQDYYNKWKPQPKAIFKLGEATIWGGPADDMRFKPFNLLVCASQIPGGNRPSSRVAMSQSAADFLPPELIKPACPWIEIQWDDMSVPRLDSAWWMILVEAIKAIKGPVGFCCSGGTGRTGAALAIVAGLGGLTTQCPVAFIRKNYFRDAVETSSQLSYVEAITGLAVTSDLFSSAFDYDDAKRYDSGKVVVPSVTTSATDYPTERGKLWLK
jgi:protein-tyrosine phosphatase